MKWKISHLPSVLIQDLSYFTVVFILDRRPWARGGLPVELTLAHRVELSVDEQAY